MMGIVWLLVTGGVMFTLGWFVHAGVAEHRSIIRYGAEPDTCPNRGTHETRTTLCPFCGYGTPGS